jgi:hypothetical protein
MRFDEDYAQPSNRPILIVLSALALFIVIDILAVVIMLSKL